MVTKNGENKHAPVSRICYKHWLLYARGVRIHGPYDNPPPPASRSVGTLNLLQRASPYLRSRSLYVPPRPATALAFIRRRGVRRGLRRPHQLGEGGGKGRGQLRVAHGWLRAVARGAAAELLHEHMVRVTLLRVGRPEEEAAVAQHSTLQSLQPSLAQARQVGG